MVTLAKVPQQQRPTQNAESAFWRVFRNNARPMCIYGVEQLRLLAVNPAMVRCYGYAEQELLSMSVGHLWAGEENPCPTVFTPNDLPRPAQPPATHRHCRKDGSWIDVEITADEADCLGLPAQLLTMVDMSLRMRAERESARLQRAHQMLSSSKMALIRATAKGALLEEICRIAVEIGGYLGAWAGFARDDEAKSIDRVAFAGFVPDYVRRQRGSWAEDVSLGQGPAGRTVRSGKAVIVEDLGQLPGIQPWRDRLRPTGVGGIVSLPLNSGHQTIGLLYLFSAEVLQVGPEEIKLLQELADDLAFGIGNLQTREEARRDAQTRMEILKIQQEIALLDSDLHQVMMFASERARLLTGADAAAVDLIEGDKLVSHTESGLASMADRPLASKSLATLAVHTASTLLSPDTETDDRVDLQATREQGARSLVVIPLMVDAAVIGVLRVAWRQPRAFVDRDVANLQILVETLGATVQRHRMSAQLQASESQYRLLFAENPQPMWVYESTSWRLLAVNHAMVQHYGYSEQELLSMALQDLWFVPASGQAEPANQQLHAQSDFQARQRHRQKSGTAIDVDISVRPTTFNATDARLVLAIDVTQRLKAERDLARVSRAQQMLSTCNEVLIRASSEKVLLEKICRVAVELGGYLGAWVGYARDDEAKSIERVAFAGAVPNYARHQQSSWTDASPRGLGPSGRTIRSGEVTVVQDINQDESNRLWRQEMLEAGICGLISLPLRNLQRTFGVLFLYCQETVDAGKDEIKLLQELANDLAFGIVNLQAQHEARREVQTRSAILDIQQEISSLDTDLHQAMQILAERACGLTGADGAAVDLIEGDQLVNHVQSGLAPVGVRPLSGNSLAALAARTAQTLVSEDAETDPRVDREATSQQGVRSLVMVPLMARGQVIGVLKMAWKAPRAFAARDVTNLQILVETLGAAIQRHHLSEQLRASEHQYRLLFANNPQPMWVFDCQSLRLLAANQAMVSHYGYTETELLTMSIRDFWTDDTGAEPRERFVRQRIAEGRNYEAILRQRTRSRGIIDVDLVSNAIVFNGVPARLVMAIDITQRLRAERDLARVSRAQQMLSTCNEALIRATSQDSLLSDICRITVDIGGYRGAWVGFAHDDAARSVSRMACAGVMPDDSSSEKMSWSEASPRGKGPVGRTIRSGKVVIVSNVEHEDRLLLPRRKELLAAGIRSMVSLPLRNAGRTFGVLFLFAQDVLEIRPDEIVLLQELANDLAFGIGNLRAQEEQRRIQAAVLKVAAAVSASSGLEFFAQLARNMAEALGAQAAFVSRLLPGEPVTARSLAAVCKGQMLENFDYAIQGTPSEALAEHGRWSVAEHASKRYPGAPWLAQMEAQAYVGQRLDDANGQAVGHIFVLFDTPQEKQEFVLSTLQIFAARVAAEMQRQKADAYIRDQAALLDKAHDAIILRDLVHGVVFWNQGAERLYGWTAQEAHGHLMADRLNTDLAQFQENLHKLLATGDWKGEVEHRRKDGSLVAVESHWTLVHDDQGQPQSVLSINTDITQRKAAEREIQHLAFYDQLTQLPNRLLLMDRLQHALAGSARNGLCGALLFIDLDNFKTLNDTLGHESGDMLLQQVAVRLLNCVREVDTIARFGGDEFVVMLEDLSDNDAEAALLARDMGEKILATLAVPYTLNGFEHSTTSSIGVAPFGQEHKGVTELLKQADLAMYQAKTAGRNAIRFFNPSMQAIVNTRVQLELEMRHALAQQEYLLHYQPQFDAAGRIIGAEALVRWRHPRRGAISPAEFIPTAEDTGIIIPLGQWVLDTACRLLKGWQAHPGTAHLSMAVNVSARQFHSPDFVEQVTQVVRCTGVDARQLKLELTESLLVNDLDQTVAKMTALKALGIGFSLDDFGTGYSSLSYLKRLPLDQLKIDQSFVRDVVDDVNDASIVRTIIALGQSLGLAVMAEGVETNAQRDFLAMHGCMSYQGYLFSRPLPAADLQKLLHTAAA